MKEDFKYEIVDNFDHVIDEKGAKFIALRKIRWGDNPSVKLEIRNWFSNKNGETCGKGVSFLTDDGPNNLAETLVDLGYGDTKTLIRSLAKRNNIEIPEDSQDDEYFDLQDIINSMGA